jgi:hypothetical protein
MNSKRRYLTRKGREAISHNIHMVRTTREDFLGHAAALGIGAVTGIMPAPYSDNPEQIMSDQTDREREEDGKADAIAATAIITIVVLVMYVWLSGMPT